MSTNRLSPLQQMTAGRRERPAAPVSAELAAEISNPLRRMGLLFSLAFIFLRFSQIHELLTFTVGFNTYILYFFGPPAIALAILAGGVQRLFSSRIAWLWTGFLLWMLLSAPFSFWRGESISLFLTYMRTEFPCLLLIAGLCVTWADLRKFLIVIGAAAMCNIPIAKYLLVNSEGRMYLGVGTMSNANDLAAHLILVMPFLLLGILWPKQYSVLRLILAAFIAYGLYLVLGTGSRGALVALLAVSLFSFLRGTNMLRLAALVLTPLTALGLLAFLPEAPKERLLSLFSSEAATAEASESSARRTYLLLQSLRLTAEHPIFGVGVGQFMNFEADQAKREGLRGAWQVSHNSYTQVSSELGIPGIVFFLGAIIATYLAAARNQKQARQRPEWKPIELTAFCLLLSLVGFCVAIFFLSLAYRMYLPTLSALVIAMTGILRNEMALSPGAAPALPPWAPRALPRMPKNELAARLRP